MYPFTKLPKSLLYGEEYTFIINKLMAKSIIEKIPIKTKALSFVFVDTMGREYKHKIRLTELKSILD